MILTSAVEVLTDAITRVWILQRVVIITAEDLRFLHRETEAPVAGATAGWIHRRRDFLHVIFRVSQKWILQ
jgi:hypothetical protein